MITPKKQNKMANNNGRARRGLSLVWMSVGFTALIAMASLAVDFGHVQLARRQLQDAADAAALAAAADLSTSTTAAQNTAVAIGAANSCDGTSVVVDPNNDVQFLDYNSATRQSTVLTGSARSTANAVRVSLSRTQAKGNPVALTFAKILGMSTCDIHTTATAYAQQASGGYIGLSLTRMYNTARFDGYDSGAGPYTLATAQPSMLLSYKDLWLYDYSYVLGEAHCDLSGTLNMDGTATVTGGTPTKLNLRSSFPSVDPGTAATVNNNSQLTSNYSNGSLNVAKGKGTVPYPGGTYYLKQLVVSTGSTVSFTGPTLIYLAGSGTIQGTLEAASLKPADLSVRVLPSNNVSIDGGTFYGCLYNPTGDVHHHNGGISYGSVISDLLCFRQTSQGHQDLTLGKYATPTGAVALTN